MSKYGEIRYYSASRKAFVEIDTMPTPHLSRAAKKLAHTMAEAWGADDRAIAATTECDRYADEGFSALDVLEAMIDDLASRVPPAGAPV